jgi:murein tripeptide amidase MpaA
VAAVVVFGGAVALARDGDEPVRYDDHALVRARITSAADIQTMRKIATTLMSEGEGIGLVDYVVSPGGLKAMEASGITYRVLVENLQPLIDEERERLAAGGVAGSPWFGTFRDYDAVNAKLDELETLRPDLASVFVAGLSLEGREIRGIRITGPGTDKPAVLLNSCQHAREWASVMVNMYAADQLITQYDVDQVVKDLVDEVEFFVIPIVNPDGYIYTWGPNRLWRKNRRNNGNGTFGVDLNRNWGYQWGYDNEGSDPYSGSDTYRGPAPFSEPETQVMRDFYLAHPRIVANLDFHTHGFLILYPWGYDYVTAPDVDLLHDLGETMEDSIFAVHGVPYTNQQGVYLYPTNGDSIDWTYGDQGVFSYTVELRTGGSSGHELPPWEIIPNGEEIFPAVLDIAEFATQGVQFGFPSGVPDAVEADFQTPVQVRITGITAGLEPGTAKIFTRVGASGPFAEAALTDLGGRLFEGLLPAAPCREVVQFYFEVQTTDTVVHHSPDDAPVSYYEATAYEITVAIADNFETDQGWTTEVHGATTGYWIRGVPVDDPGWDHDPAADGDGSGQAFLTHNQPGNTDVDQGEVLLMSPLLDLSAGNLVISYEYFLRLTDPESTDHLLVEISSNGDTGPWTLITDHDTDGGLTWRHHEITQADLDAVGVTPTSTMMIRFTANDADPQSINEAGVDGFVVRSLFCEAPPCPWDCEDAPDDTVDVGDFLALLAQWGSPGTCDFDGGGVGVTDFLELLANWGLCP